MYDQGSNLDPPTPSANVLTMAHFKHAQVVIFSYPNVYAKMMFQSLKLLRQNSLVVSISIYELNSVKATGENSKFPLERRKM